MSVYLSMDGWMAFISYLKQHCACLSALKQIFLLKIIYSINEEQQYRGRSHSATSWLGVELWLPARHLLTRTCLSTLLLGSSYNVFGVFGVLVKTGHSVA